MLSALLVRLAMVAVTMAVVCWIGWTIPASRDAETLQAQGPVESDRVPLLSVPSTSPQALSVMPYRRRLEEGPRQSPAVTLDVNLANQQDFERLPGIGPVLARRIVQYREAQGKFQDIEQLRRVKGIGKKIFDRIRGFVLVGPPAVSRPARKTA